MIKDTFNQKELLTAVDKIFPLAKHYSRILEIHLDELQNCENIIDLGCGTGILTIKYLENNQSVTAIDLAEESLSVLKQKGKKFPKLKILKSDMCDLKEFEKESFDGASSMIASHLVDNYRKHISEVYRILKSKGKFIITARCAGQDQEKIIEIVKKSLLDANKLEEYHKEFVILRDQLLSTARKRSKSLFSTEEAKLILQNAGFRNIKEFKNESEDVMYSLSAEK